MAFSHQNSKRPSRVLSFESGEVCPPGPSRHWEQSLWPNPPRKRRAKEGSNAARVTQCLSGRATGLTPGPLMPPSHREATSADMGTFGQTVGSRAISLCGALPLRMSRMPAHFVKDNSWSFPLLPPQLASRAEGVPLRCCQHRSGALRSGKDRSPRHMHNVLSPRPGPRAPAPRDLCHFLRTFLFASALATSLSTPPGVGPGGASPRTSPESSVCEPCGQTAGVSPGLCTYPGDHGQEQESWSLRFSISKIGMIVNRPHSLPILKRKFEHVWDLTLPRAHMQPHHCPAEGAESSRIPLSIGFSCLLSTRKNRSSRPVRSGWK